MSEIPNQQWATRPQPAPVHPQYGRSLVTAQAHLGKKTGNRQIETGGPTSYQPQRKTHLGKQRGWEGVRTRHSPVHVGLDASNHVGTSRSPGESVKDALQTMSPAGVAGVWHPGGNVQLPVCSMM